MVQSSSVPISIMTKISMMDNLTWTTELSAFYPLSIFIRVVSFHASFVTVSWNIFTEHFKTSLVGGSDKTGSEDSGHLRYTQFNPCRVNMLTLSPGSHTSKTGLASNLFKLIDVIVPSHNLFQDVNSRTPSIRFGTAYVLFSDYLGHRSLISPFSGTSSPTFSTTFLTPLLTPVMVLRHWSRTTSSKASKIPSRLIFAEDCEELFHYIYSLY